MRKILIFSFLAGIAGVLTGCHEETDSVRHTPKSLPGADTISIHLVIQRLDSSLFACRTRTDVEAWVTANPAFVRSYFPEAGKREQLVSELFRRVNEPSLHEFYGQTKESFGNFDTLRRELTTAFRHLKAYDPAFRVPEIRLAFTGFLGSDLVLTDSTITIGTDYFLGNKAKFRPDVYGYQLWRYNPKALVPQILFILSEKYVETNRQDKSLLNEMIGYGKAYEFAQTLLPETPDSLLIGYTGKQLAETEIAQDLVWAHLIDNKLLYETNPMKKVKYTGDRPTTFEIGPRCPGSIGRWVGWQIVRFYKEQNPDVTVRELMQNKDARQILELSKYRGQTPES